MTKKPVSEFIDAESLDAARLEQERQKEREKLLRKVINIGLLLEHENLSLTWPATMVLLFIAMVPGVTLSIIAKWLRVSPGGVSKIIDQLSVGRMVRGERQAGLGLVVRTEAGMCTLTSLGEQVIEQVLDRLRE